MTDEMIKSLEEKGFKRWTKNGMDRLYINAYALGLELDYYKTGNISSAQFKGKHISNSEGYRLKDAKTYIDLVKNVIYSDSPTLAAEVAEIMGIDYSYGYKTIEL